MLTCQHVGMDVRELEHGWEDFADVTMLLRHELGSEEAARLALPVEVELLRERVEGVAVVQEALVRVADLVARRERLHGGVAGVEHLQPDDVGRLARDHGVHVP